MGEKYAPCREKLDLAKWYYVFVLMWGKRPKIFPQIFFFSSFIERIERGLVGLEGSEGELVSGYKEPTLAPSLQFVFGSARDNITCRPDNWWPWWSKYAFSHSFVVDLSKVLTKSFQLQLFLLLVANVSLGARRLRGNDRGGCKTNNNHGNSGNASKQKRQKCKWKKHAINKEK